MLLCPRAAKSTLFWQIDNDDADDDDPIDDNAVDKDKNDDDDAQGLVPECKSDSMSGDKGRCQQSFSPHNALRQDVALYLYFVFVECIFVSLNEFLYSFYFSQSLFR